MNTEVGAGTLNPATFLRVLGPEPWRVAYVEPSVRPDDSRYGENPNRMQTPHPVPGDPQARAGQPAGALPGQPGRARHRRRRARRAVRRGQLGLAGAGRVGAGLGGVAGRPGDHPVHLLPAGRRAQPRPAVGGDHLRHRADPDGAAGRDATSRTSRTRPGVSYGEVFGQAEYEMSRYYLDDADVATNRAAARAVRGRGAAADRRRPAGARAHVRAEVLARLQRAGRARRGRPPPTGRPSSRRMRRLAGEVARLWIATPRRTGPPARACRAAAARRPARRRRRRRREPSRGRWSSRSAPRRCRRPRPARRADQVRARADRPARRHPAAARRRPGARHPAPADRARRRRGRPRGRPRPHGQGPEDRRRVRRGRRAHPGARGLRPRPTAWRSTTWTRVDVDGAEYVAVHRAEPGRPAAEVLGRRARPRSSAALRSAKNMRWNDPALAFTRPIRWLLALLGRPRGPGRGVHLAAGRETRGAAATPATPVVAVAVAPRPSGDARGGRHRRSTRGPRAT